MKIWVSLSLYFCFVQSLRWNAWPFQFSTTRTQFFGGLFPINFFVYLFASLHPLRIIVKPLGITIPLTCPSTFYRSLAFSNGHTFSFVKTICIYKIQNLSFPFFFILCFSSVCYTRFYVWTMLLPLRLISYVSIHRARPSFVVRFGREMAFFLSLHTQKNPASFLFFFLFSGLLWPSSVLSNEKNKKKKIHKKDNAAWHVFSHMQTIRESDTSNR